MDITLVTVSTNQEMAPDKYYQDITIGITLVTVSTHQEMAPDKTNDHSWHAVGAEQLSI
jgi:hypothetical protein